MAWFNFWKSREKTEIQKETDEIEQLERKVRKNRAYFLKRKLERLKEKQAELELQEEIDELEDELYGDDDDSDVITPPQQTDSPEALFGSLLMNAFAKQQQANKPPVQTTLVGEERKSLSDAELREYKNKIPAPNLAMAKRMSEAELIPIVSEQLAGCDDSTIARAIKILKE